jgi:(R,R)-butanediol dehydrogenase/meso-butanediol dehydrogenase/diacetyl reductase
MQAAIITGRQQIESRAFPDPVLRSGGAIVDVTWCGICGTDVHAFYSGGPLRP